MSQSKSEAYIETPLPKISSGLEKLFASMEESNQKPFAKVSGNNFVMLSTAETNSIRMEDILGSFASVNPSRFFVVCLNDKIQEIQPSISARCHAISGDQTVCSEVIRLECPPSSLIKLPSIIRGNSVSGRAIQFFLYDTRAVRELLPSLWILAESILYDSSTFSDGLESISELMKFPVVLTDLEWIRLGPWRDQIKEIFDRTTIADLLPTLYELEIKTGKSQKGDTASLLLAGWITSKLRMDPISCGSNGFEFRSPTGAPLRLRIGIEGSATHGLLDSVLFRFSGKGKRSEIRLKRGKVLETTVTAGEGFKISRPFDDESDYGLIRRFHLVGESTRNFGPALQSAIDLYELRKGFERR